MVHTPVRQQERLLVFKTDSALLKMATSRFRGSNCPADIDKYITSYTCLHDMKRCPTAVKPLLYLESVTSKGFMISSTSPL